MLCCVFVATANHAARHHQQSARAQRTRTSIGSHTQRAASNFSNLSRARLHRDSAGAKLDL